MLTKSQIDVIHDIYMERKFYRCTANSKGIIVHTSQLWIKKIRVSQPNLLPTNKKKPGKKMLLSNRTLNVIKRQTESNMTFDNIQGPVGKKHFLPRPLLMGKMGAGL